MPLSGKRILRSAGLVIATVLSGCQSPPITPIAVSPHVDLERFMGDWYVIANIPTFVENDAYNPVESYRLDDDGTIRTTFTFRAGSYDGKVKTYHPRGHVLDRKTNAIWGMEFVWPIQADYRILHVSANYSQTIIGRNKRDHVWIMARTPVIPESDYQALVRLAGEQGYDVKLIRKVPQQSPR